jgi:hypothetical protein
MFTSHQESITFIIIQKIHDKVGHENYLEMKIKVKDILTNSPTRVIH